MKRKLLFVYNHEYPELWKDGLYAALRQLSFDYKITLCNLFTESLLRTDLDESDFVLGWGAFSSKVDRALQSSDSPTPKGLCIAGVAAPPVGMERYNVLFHETDWYFQHIKTHPNTVKAFGVNTEIYRPSQRRKTWDYITVGAFATWKRQHLLLNKPGLKLAIGEVQKGNPRESLGIVAKLVGGGVMVSDMVPPEELANFYRMSETAYIPADIFGGGERAVLEARSCGIKVEVEPDNPKLIELAVCEIPTEEHYANQLRKGIESCL